MSYAIADIDTFGNAALPVAKPPMPEILGASSLIDWFTADPLWIDGHASDATRCGAWRARSNGGTILTPLAVGNAPLMATEGNSGKPSLQFVSTRPDQLVWDGVFPSGGSAKSSKVFIGQLTATASTKHLIGNVSSAYNLLAQGNAAILSYNAQGASGPQIQSSTITPGWNEPLLAITSFNAVTGTAKLRTVSATLGDETVTGSVTPGPANAAATMRVGSRSATPSTSNSPDMHLLDVAFFEDDVFADADLLAAIADYARGRYGIGA